MFKNTFLLNGVPILLTSSTISFDFWKNRVIKRDMLYSISRYIIQYQHTLLFLPIKTKKALMSSCICHMYTPAGFTHEKRQNFGLIISWLSNWCGVCSSVQWTHIAWLLYIAPQVESDKDYTYACPFMWLSICSLLCDYELVGSVYLQTFAFSNFVSALTCLVLVCSLLRAKLWL